MALSDLRRDSIKERAVSLFAESGADAVSIRDIAVACGMSAANFYAHFPSKSALVEEIFREGMIDYATRLKRVSLGRGHFALRLLAMIEAMLALHDADRDRFRFLLLQQHRHLDGLPMDDRNPVQVMRDVIAEFMDRGEIPRRDPDLMALAIVGLIVQPATGHLYGRLQGNLAERSEEIAGMCERVLS